MRSSDADPRLKAALELMERDALFADGVWKLSYLDKERSLGLVEKRQLAYDLGVRLAKHSGFEAREAFAWLLENVHVLSERFNEFGRYGSSTHKATALGVIFGALFRERRSPSRDELDAALPTLTNLFFTVLSPFLALAGVMTMRPIVTAEDRLFFMAFGVFNIFGAKLALLMYRQPLGGYSMEQVRRRMGGAGLNTPLRVHLSAEIFEGAGKGMVFYSIGTFLNDAFGFWELVLAVATGCVILYELGKLMFGKNRRLV